MISHFLQCPAGRRSELAAALGPRWQPNELEKNADEASATLLKGIDGQKGAVDVRRAGQGCGEGETAEYKEIGASIPQTVFPLLCRVSLGILRRCNK